MKLFYTALSLFLCLTVKHSFANTPTKLDPFAPPACPGMTVTASSDSVRCKGEKNGVARVIVTGADPISYFWDDANSQTTAAATGLGAGIYNVVITDGNGCVENASVTVEEPNVVLISAVSTPVVCNGQSNGAIDLTVTGGTSPYYFNWSTNDTSEDLTNLSSGSYSVISSDSKGCVAVKTIAITQPQAISLSTTVSHATCKGINDGAINLSVNGGTNPFTFSWSNTETTEDLSGLAVGTYTVTATDFNGCSKNTSASITEPQFALSLSSVIIHPTCNNLSNGRIDLQLAGGTGPFTFNWDNGFTVEDPTAIGAGSYKVIVTDKNGCLDSLTSVLISPSAIVLTTSSTNVSACGLSDGSATASVSGGITPYSYLWNDGLAQTSATANALSAGTYSIVVKDSNNCATSTSVNVNFNGGLSAVTTVTDVLCFGGNNGEITVNVSGGTGPYNYAWSNSGTNATISALTAGTYAVTVSDINGCTYFKTATVSQPNILALDLIVTNTSCFGTADGSVDLTVSGGTTPYNFSWSNGPTSEDISPLDTGSYSVLVTDANACSANASATIYQPATMAVFMYKKDVKCFNGNDGEIEITITGGTTPYSYLWSNSDTVQNIINAPIGNYSVIVTDLNGCQATNDTSLNQPTELVLSAITTHLICNGLGNGEIDLTVSGGSPNYSYLWSNSEVDQDVVGLSGGFYDVTVTDFNGCSKNLALAVAEPDSIELALVSTLASCGMSDGTASVTVTGGTPSYQYSWLPTSQTTTNAVGLAAGVYNITITDGNSCIKNGSVIINNPNGPSISLVGNNTKCYGNTDGTISIDLSGATEPYTYYVIFNSDTIETYTGVVAGNYVSDSLSPGSYFISAIDAAGCKSTKSVVVNQPTILSVTGTATNVVCYGGSNGSIDITAAGGVSPFTYLWNTTSVIEDQVNLPKGSYSVVVSDSNNCTATKSFVIIENSTQISVSTKNVIQSSCPDTQDGSVELVITGGNAPYTVLWASNGSTSVVLSNISKGSYTVTVTDSKGCTKDKTVTIGAIDVCAEVKLEKIPNAFSPNGDGYNDTWVIRNIQKFPESKVSIFNRWGNLIFSSDGYNQPWDGTYSNEPVVEGTYYYVIDLGPDQDIISGTVTVIR